MNFNTKDCCYKGGNKHKFQACYSERPIERSFDIQGASAEQIRKLLFYEVYCGDVCEWCGKVVNNQGVIK